MRVSLLGSRKSSARARVGGHAFRMCFAIPAVLVAAYVTVWSGEIVAWQTSAVVWVLTLLVIWLIDLLGSMIEKCEHEAIQEGGAMGSPPKGLRNNEPGRAGMIVEERLAHLEQVIVRQHRFVSDAAHELRTPLTAQSLVGENVLAGQRVSETELREAIVSMLEESKHMKRLIEGLLDLTRASLTSAANHGTSRQPAALDLSALTLDCVESLRVLAEEKQQSIEVNAADQLWADADLTIVRQAVLNVIHNSIEHCPEGARIQVDTARRSPQEALIRVQDNGPGIPLQEQDRVFERFYRGSGVSRRRGLGLGLSIAKAILCSQGGGVELRSTPGAGCCFLLTLPLMPGAGADPAEPGGSDLDLPVAQPHPRERGRLAIWRFS